MRLTRTNGLFWFAQALLTFAILRGNHSWWEPLQVLPMLSAIELATLGLVLLAASALPLQFLRPDFLSGAFSSISIILGLLILSSWMDTDYSLLLGPLIRGELLLFFLLCVALRKTDARLVFSAALILTLVGMTTNYILLADGRLLFSDDHPPFLHRLLQLTENFPNIPIYDVMWNGGLDSMYLFASGVLNVFAIFSPLLYLLGPEASYSLLPLAICVLVTPISTYLAARVYGLKLATASASALLSVTASLFWYRWCLKYGTLGFATSAALFPLALALLARVIEGRERFRIRHAAALVVLCTLSLCWPLMGLALLPAAVLIAVRAKRTLKNPKFLAAAFLILIINLPWMWLFVKDFALAKAVQPTISSVNEANSTAPPQDIQTESGTEAHSDRFPLVQKPKPIGLMTALEILREHRAATHPLLLFLTLPGLLLMARWPRILLFLTLGWLLVLGAVLSPKVPQFEFRRFIELFLLLSAIPAGVAVTYTWENRSNWPNIIIAALLGAFLFAGGRGAVESMGSKRIERFYFAGPFLKEFSSKIREHSGEGRVLFSGFMLHDLEKGHLAPLTYFTERPLLASSHVHNLWFYKQIFPEWAMRGGGRGVKLYLDLFNVTAVIAHEGKWIRYFAPKTNEYEKVWQGKEFVLFRRKVDSSSYFLQGSGTILQQSNAGVRLQLDTPDALIKFRYYPSLVAKGCTLEAKAVAPDLEFIALKNCPTGVPIMVESRSFFSRVVGGRYE